VARRVVLCLACTLAACGQDEAPPPVPIGGFAIAPERDRLTALDGNLTLHPKALAGLVYDDNVFAGDPARGDFYALLAAGVTARQRFDETADLSADAELDVLRYHAHPELDVVGGQAGLAYAHRDLTDQQHASASFQRQQQSQFETGELLIADTYRLSGDAEHRALYESYGADLSAARVRYRQNSRLFTAEQANHDDYGVGVSYGWEYARTEGVFAHLLGSHTSYETHETYNDSSGIALRFGWHGLEDERTTMRAEAGVEYRRYQVVNDQPPFNRRDAVAPSVAVDLEWPWGEGHALGVKATSAIVDNASSSAAWSYGASTSLRYRLVELADLVGSLGVTQQRNLEAAPGEEREVRTEGSAGVGIEMRWRSGIGVRLAGSYVDSQSNVPPTYRRFIGTVEIAAAY
jgi:hypothetical protein